MYKELCTLQIAFKISVVFKIILRGILDISIMLKSLHGLAACSNFSDITIRLKKYCDHNI